MIILLAAGNIALFFNPTTQKHCQYTVQYTGYYNIHKLQYLGNINKPEYSECNLLRMGSKTKTDSAENIESKMKSQQPQSNKKNF